MTTGYGRQANSDEMTAPLRTLIELCATQSERLGHLSGQMAKVVSVLERLSGHIGDSRSETRIHPAPAEVAAIGARAGRVTLPDECVPVDLGSGQPANIESLLGVVHPKRAYGAPSSPPGSAAPAFRPDGDDICQAKCGNVVLAVGRGHAGYSADGGNTFTPLNPSTTFPHWTDGGSCCDQAAQYLPGVDRFVWIMQFSPGANGHNCLRIAAASPREMICTKFTGWTFWDLSAARPSLDKGMNRPEISASRNVLRVTIGQRETGLSVLEFPLQAIRAGGPAHWRLHIQSNSARSREGRLHSLAG